MGLAIAVDNIMLTYKEYIPHYIFRRLRGRGKESSFNQRVQGGSFSQKGEKCLVKEYNG